MANVQLSTSNPVQQLEAKSGPPTPTILYTWAGAIAVLMLIVAALSFFAVRTMTTTGDRIENSTGPVLISTQGLVASIAEADAANSTVFLSALDGGDEDVSQRRLYESALARAPQQIEDISAGIGDDVETHDALKRVAQQLTSYAGVVEQARFSNLNDVGNAEALLSESLVLSGENGMLGNAEDVASRTGAQFEEDLSAGNTAVLAALVAIVITFAVLIVAQVRLKALTKRLFNIGLVLSTVCVVALFVWLLVASAFRAGDLSSAEAEGFGDITGAAELLTAAFEYKTDEARAIIEADPSELPDEALATEISSLISALDGSGDSARERALTLEVNQRWERYLTTSETIASNVRNGDINSARALVAGSGNQNFNGFNTSAEALSLLNQDEFTSAVLDANARIQWLNFGTLLLPLLAGIFAWLGYRPRINEYF